MGRGGVAPGEAATEDTYGKPKTSAVQPFPGMQGDH